MKQTTKRIFAVLLVLALAVCACGCSSGTNDKQTQNPQNTADLSKTCECTLTIDATKAFENSALDEAVRAELSNGGMIYNGASVRTAKGQTVTDLLVSITRLSSIVVDIQNGEYGSFIQGICGLYNGACGENSYWLLRVNGEYSEVGADSVIINEGDEITWIFTCDGGADIGYVWGE